MVYDRGTVCSMVETTRENQTHLMSGGDYIGSYDRNEKFNHFPRVFMVLSANAHAISVQFALNHPGNGLA